MRDLIALICLVRIQGLEVHSEAWHRVHVFLGKTAARGNSVGNFERKPGSVPVIQLYLSTTATLGQNYLAVVERWPL